MVYVEVFEHEAVDNQTPFAEFLRLMIDQRKPSYDSQVQT